jgi:molecular chaperone GrpE
MAEKKEEILEEVLEELENEAKENETKESETMQSEAVQTDADSAEEQSAGDGAAETETNADAAESEADAADEGAEDAADTKAEGQSGGETKKGFFKKKKDKRDEQIEELNDKLRRQMAEFENFRKRTEKEKTQMYDMGARSVIEKFLPVIDNFERGFAAVPEESKDDAFVTGMDKVYRQMLTELDAIGVKPIAAVGEEFDPDYHNAVMQVASEEYDSGIVAQELQKGYTYKDYVVRHSMVAVVE